MKLPYKKPKVRTGDLNTPVHFYSLSKNKHDPSDVHPTKEVYTTYAQVYAPSQKDITMLDNNDASTGVTIKIRNTKGEFTPNHTMQVVIDDYRYDMYVWNVKDVRPDFENNFFDVVVLNNASQRGSEY